MIADENGNTDWLLDSNAHGYNAFYSQVDTLLVGRKAFEKIMSRGPWPFESHKTFVFSKKLKNQYGPNIKIIHRDVCAFVDDLKEEVGGRIWLIGGASLARALMSEDLVDEVVLSIRPEMLGTGIRLYPLPLHSMFWELKESVELPTGALHVRYVLKSSDIANT